jgi:predicted transposase/invertase (TIGR01784 family)
VTELKYKFTNDVLFRILFTSNTDLLKKLVADLLVIPFENISEFVITNPDVPPEVMGEKYCRLDINMIVNGQRTNLEVQVRNEGNYSERSLYYWAREFSSSLSEGEDYIDLPRTIVISIIDFKLFDCVEFHSEFQTLEVNRHEPLTDKMCLHYFELPKLPKSVSKDDTMKLWLTLFNAKTEEELKQIESMGVSVMEQAVTAYRKVTATDEFKEIERLRSRARHDEASALGNAERKGIEKERKKWESVVADKDALIAELQAKLNQQ